MGGLRFCSGHRIEGEEVSQAAVAKVLAKGVVDRLVLTEDHASKERPVGRRHPGHDGELRTLAHAVESAGKATAPTPGTPRMVEKQLTGDASPAKVSGKVER